jgi:hypothetical protein
MTAVKISNRGAAALAPAVVATTGGVLTVVAQVKTNVPDPDRLERPTKPADPISH